MVEILAAAAAAFVSTNLDDLFILMLLFAHSETRVEKYRIAAGQYLGLGALTVFSMLCALGLGYMPEQYLRLLGLVPVALGIRAWIRRQEEAENIGLQTGVLATAALTVANGGDNLGIYIALFAGFSVKGLIITVVVFTVFCGLWCLLGAKLAALPRVQAAIRRWKGILVPAVLILLGLSILLSV